MRKFYVEVANPVNWERIHRVLKVKANTINGAISKSMKRKDIDEDIYQICTRVKKRKLDQPVWDFFNGNISKHFGLNL